MSPNAARHPSAGAPSRASRQAVRPNRTEIPRTGSESSKPNLRIAPKPPRRFRKLFVTGITLGLMGLVAIPFGIVFLHANLLAGQRDLDQMRQDLNAQLELRQQLLFDRSLAVSPQRIITIASEQLGMVQAENIVYLQSIGQPSLEVPTDSAVPQPTP